MDVRRRRRIIKGGEENVNSTHDAADSANVPQRDEARAHNHAADTRNDSWVIVGGGNENNSSAPVTGSTFAVANEATEDAVVGAAVRGGSLLMLLALIQVNVGGWVAVFSRSRAQKRRYARWRVGYRRRSLFVSSTIDCSMRAKRLR